ncbi:hypothetical protein, partial [Kitasatospora aureofaciens]|uniref:hypothetical protein n=1 Tax=Kitasatospora aureofaciens TaxID=1894 RepID=UPI001F415036
MTKADALSLMPCTEPGAGGDLPPDGEVAGGDGLQADDLAVLEDSQVQGPVVRRPVPSAQPV